MKRLAELQAAKSNKAATGKVTEAEARRRKEAALAELREIEIAEKRGELIDVAQMEQAWSTVGQTIRDNLLGMPDKLTPMLAAMTDKKQIRSYLMSEFQQLLTALPARICKRGN